MKISSSILEYFNYNIGDNIKLIFFVGLTIGIGVLTYFTFKVLVNHRKYSHIPGPPNKG
jgi:hypothetical protein